MVVPQFSSPSKSFLLHCRSSGLSGDIFFTTPCACCIIRLAEELRESKILNGLEIGVVIRDGVKVCVSLVGGLEVGVSHSVVVFVGVLMNSGSDTGDFLDEVSFLLLRNQSITQIPAMRHIEPITAPTTVPLILSSET